MIQLLDVSWKEVRGRAAAAAASLANTLKVPYLTSNRHSILYSGVNSPCFIFDFKNPDALLLATMYPLAEIRCGLGVDTQGAHAIPLIATLMRDPGGLNRITQVLPILHSFSSGIWGPWKGGDGPLQRFALWWKRGFMATSGDQEPDGTEDDPFTPELLSLKRLLSACNVNEDFPNIQGFKAYVTPPPSFIASYPTEGNDHSISTASTWKDWEGLVR